jgi:CDP-diacylglycerol--glycerol-3-phosphate 3-phosphatidyltransferase
VNAANLLTGARIAVVPLLIFLLTDDGRASSVLAAATFFVACLSDYLDGYLAREHGMGTDLGKFLDPLADKLLVVSALIMLAAMDDPRVPAWLVAAIAVRELSVTALRTIALQNGIVLEADELGKYKMIYQMFALHGLLLHYPFWGIDFQGAGTCFLWVSVVLGFWSAAKYHIRVIREVHGAPA